jgi:hypothetical protein
MTTQPPEPREVLRPPLETTSVGVKISKERGVPQRSPFIAVSGVPITGSTMNLPQPHGQWRHPARASRPGSRDPRSHVARPLQRPLDGSRWWCWSHLNSPVCVVISDVHRFVPATTSYMSALAVARLCAQTAQDAIYGFCALCSRTDAGTVASLTDPGPGPCRSQSLIATRRSTGFTKPSGRSPAYPPRCAARSWRPPTSTCSGGVRSCAGSTPCAVAPRSAGRAGRRASARPGGAACCDALHEPSVRRRSSSLMSAGRG